MNKKIFMSGLAALMSLLVACAPSGTAVPTAHPTQPVTEPTATTAAVKPVTISIMHQFNDAESAKFEEIVARFEAENPGIKIAVERNNEASYYDKLVTTILGGSAPDIARVEPPKAAQYIAAGMRPIWIRIYRRSFAINFLRVHLSR